MNVDIREQRLYTFCVQHFDGNITRKIAPHQRDKKTLGDFLDEIEYCKSIFRDKYFGIGKKRTAFFCETLHNYGIIIK